MLGWFHAKLSTKLQKRKKNGDAWIVVAAAMHETLEVGVRQQVIISAMSDWFITTIAITIHKNKIDGLVIMKNLHDGFQVALDRSNGILKTWGCEVILIV